MAKAKSYKPALHSFFLTMDHFSQHYWPSLEELSVDVSSVFLEGSFFYL